MFFRVLDVCDPGNLRFGPTELYEETRRWLGLRGRSFRELFRMSPGLSIRSTRT
ncbi:hypothetical protein LguiA_016359 [Lonicera macranthoides]